MLYIGLQRYTKETVEKLMSVNLDGVILGDLLCDRKMFPYGDVELTDLMKVFKNECISVIYQTPMYATDRIFSSVLQKVTYFYMNCLIDAVIVQDIGLASVIREKCSDLAIIWGRMGYARTPVINENTLLFYMQHGINAFECNNSKQAEYASQIGAVPYLVYGYPKYLTINRECYYRFEHNQFADDCAEGCLKHEKMLIPANNEIETTMDGYVLGWQHVYDESVKSTTVFNHCNIYADSFSVAEMKLNELRECQQH